MPRPLAQLPKIHMCLLASGVQGWRLWLQQLRALLAKRALCAARDGWAALVQVAVPVLLVLLALWTNHISAALPQQPPLALDRCGAAAGKALVVAVHARMLRASLAAQGDLQ